MDKRRCFGAMYAMAAAAVVLFTVGLTGPPCAAAGSSAVKNPNNPKPFQNFTVSPSATLMYYFSDKGRAMLQQSQSPVAKSILGAVEALRNAQPNPGTPPPLRFALVRSGERPAGLPLERPMMSLSQPPRLVPALNPVRVTLCGTANGTVFNRELAKGALPQNEETVDFFANAVSPTGTGGDVVIEGANDYRGFFGTILGGTQPLDGVTGYYVDLNASSSCSPGFEGALPVMFDPLDGTVDLPGGGDPGTVTDNTRGNVFAVDLRLDFETTGVGISKSTLANLKNTTNCPAGTHNAAAEKTCWPTQALAAYAPITGDVVLDNPHIAVDERPSGTGAGDVYVTFTYFDFFTNFSTIDLVACKNDLSACSSVVTISHTDGTTQFGDLRVRPDGKIDVTYVNDVNFPEQFQIRYVQCNPSGAPFTPACGLPVTITTEKQPLDFLAQVTAHNDFRVFTWPVHDSATCPSGTTACKAGAIVEWTVWARCKIPDPFFGLFPCPDADLMVSTSVNGGATWSAPAALASFLGDQYFPWIRVDRSSNVANIVFYDSSPDFYQHKPLVRVIQRAASAPGSNLAGTPFALTSSLTDPASDETLVDFFYGDYIGIAARAGRAYAGYTYNARKGQYVSGLTTVNTPNQDNYLAAFTY